MNLVNRIKEVIAFLEEIETEGRAMTKDEKAKAKKVLLSIAKHRLKELKAEQEMTEYWGERCKDFNSECIACHAWKHFDDTGEIAK